jgi:hypothetical protein
VNFFHVRIIVFLLDSQMTFRVFLTAFPKCLNVFCLCISIGEISEIV